jgi:CBS domain-containing protein
VSSSPGESGSGKLLGLLEDDDLLVQESRLHIPTAVNILGGVLEWPPSVHHFEAELRKALGATVGDVMDTKVPTCTEDDTIEDVATRMHEQNLRRIPVVRDGKLVGIVARGDVLRSIVEGQGSRAAGEAP